MRPKAPVSPRSMPRSSILSQLPGKRSERLIKNATVVLGSIGGSKQAPPLMMHPEDAATRGLTVGDVKVWNERGEVILPLQVTDKVPRGVVASEKGAWLSTSCTGQTISALVSADTRADIALGACFNDTRVEVAAA